MMSFSGAPAEHLHQAPPQAEGQTDPKDLCALDAAHAARCERRIEKKGGL